MVKMLTPQYLRSQLDAARVTVDGQPIDSGVEMLRVGDDLVLIQADGSEVVIEGYFLELLEEGEEVEGERQLAEADAATYGSAAGVYTEGALPAVTADVGALGEFQVAQLGFLSGAGLFGTSMATTVAIAAAVVVGAVVIAKVLEDDDKKVEADPMVTYDPTGKTLAFVFAEDVKSMTVAAVDKDGKAVADSKIGKVTAEGMAASMAAADTFLGEVGDGKTITIKATMVSGATFSKTYTYQTGASDATLKVSASDAILNGDKAFALEDGGKSVTVFEAASVTGGAGGDTITATGAVSGNIDGGAGDDTISLYAAVGGKVVGGAGKDTITNGALATGGVDLTETTAATDTVGLRHDLVTTITGFGLGATDGDVLDLSGTKFAGKLGTVGTYITTNPTDAMTVADGSVQMAKVGTLPADGAAVKALLEAGGDLEHLNLAKANDQMILVFSTAADATTAAAADVYYVRAGSDDGDYTATRIASLDSAKLGELNVANLLASGNTLSGLVVTGTDGNDKITSTAADGADSVLNGGKGHDMIFGAAGKDGILAGAGDDMIWGAAGDDTIDGGAGDDMIWGGAGKDKLTGDAGDDMIDAGDGGGDIDGGAGDDTITGGAGDDTITGGAGDDTITGGGGVDDITGGEGKDMITGGAGADKIDLAESTAATDTVFLASDAVDAITGFTAGASTGDVLDFSAVMTATAFASLSAVTAHDATLSAAVNTVNRVTGDLDTAAKLDTLLETDGGIELAATGEAIFVTAADANAGTNSVFHVAYDSTATNGAQYAVTQLATLASVDIDSFVAANFVAPN